MSSAETTSPSRPKAIIVGGGPVGLAAALTLSHPPHSYDVTVFESSFGGTAAKRYDPTKAYLYNVNARGQVLTKRFPEVHRLLVERGVVSDFSSGFIIVPADPDKDVPTTRTVSVNVNKGDYDNEGKEERKSYWIPRHDMVNIFHDVIEDYEKKRERKDISYGRIELLGGMECIKLEPREGEEMIDVTVKDNIRHVQHKHEASLVVGADGINSKVRDCLANDKTAFAPWPHMNHPNFVAKQWTSPASHLRIKVLQFPAKFPIPQKTQDPVITNSRTTYAIRSTQNAPRTYLSLGLLPMIDDDAVRPCNIISRPDHVVWTMRDGPSVQKFFQKSFPRMPFHSGGMISDEEWERFAKAEGTRFPPCQQCTGLQISSPSKLCGIVLVGDAIHAFPPDIGMGINAGLGDVVVLDDCLRGEGRVGERLGQYEKERVPEVKALIRLARFGSPFQYKQPHRIDRFRRNLWLFNVVLRLALNKISFGLIPSQSIMLSQNPKLSFSQVMFRSDCVTAGLTSVLAFGFWKLMKKMAFI